MSFQNRRCYDKGNWIVVREVDRVIVHRTSSNAAAHAYADMVTDKENFYHYVDEEEGEAIRSAGYEVKDK